MPQRSVVVLGLTCLCTTFAQAQAVRPRSADYLFASTANDVRALWVNPAALAVVSNASVMAEFALERPVDEGLRLAQWSLALNTRGLSLGYQRDRFPGASGTGALRFGLALPFPRGSLGASFTFYQGSTVDTAAHRGLNIGIRYRILPPLGLAAVVQNIGRPAPRGQVTPVTGVMALNWYALPGSLGIAADVTATERLGASGYDMRYRGGLRLSTTGRLPLGLVATLELDSGFDVDRWAVGITVGGQDRGILLWSGVAAPVSNTLDRLSLTGVSRRQLTIGGR